MGAGANSQDGPRLGTAWRAASEPGSCRYLEAQIRTCGISGMEYDARGVLKMHGNPYTAVEAIMRWDHLSLDEAVESVRAAGGMVEQRYVDNFRRLVAKAERASRSG